MSIEPIKMVLAEEDGKKNYYMIVHGLRRQIRSGHGLACYKSYTPPEQITPEELVKYKRGADMPLVLEERPKKSLPMRDWVLRNCKGKGLEFGAGYAPGRVPLGTEVRYVDRYNNEEMAAHSSAARVGSKPPSQAAVGIDIIDSFHRMEKINPNSQDFIYAAHVIEHVPDPIGAILEAIKRLKLGGQLVLVVPHRDRTFDRNRPVTSIGHLLRDHLYPSDAFEHCVDRLAYVLTPGAALVDVVKQAKKDTEAMLDMHHHTFTHTSFEPIVKYVTEVTGISHSEIDSGEDQDGIEFYVTFVK